MLIDHLDNHPMKSYFESEYKSDWEVYFQQYLNEVELERRNRLKSKLKSIYHLIFDHLCFNKISTTTLKPL